MHRRAMHRRAMHRRAMHNRTAFLRIATHMTTVACGNAVHVNAQLLQTPSRLLVQARHANAAGSFLRRR
jgi:hypothetical protein